MRLAELDALSSEERRQIATLISNPRYELIPLSGAQDSSAALPPGAMVTITTLPRLGIDATLDLSQRLSARGYDVVPHLAARMLRDRAHLADVLARMRSVGLRKAFVIGGDSPPTGELRDGLALLRAIHTQGSHFAELGVPCYPEGHPTIPESALRDDLREKQAYAHSMTTQMSFNAGAVAAWMVAIRKDGIMLPIHLGLPGVVPLAKLMKIATRIGVAHSTRYLRKHRGLVARLLQRRSFAPDAFLFELAGRLTDPAANVRLLHLFTMNDVGSTVEWQRRALEALAD
jgi:methylenetetrahydrofolate reductase (NADPH)